MNTPTTEPKPPGYTLTNIPPDVFKEVLTVLATCPKKYRKARGLYLAIVEATMRNTAPHP